METLLPNRARKMFAPLAVSISIAVLSGCGDPAPGEGMEKKMMQQPFPEVVSAQEAITSAAIPEIDPETMEQAEFQKVVGEVPYCAFRYTAESPPILVASNTGQGGVTAVTKIHGRLVKLTGDSNPNYGNLKGGLVFTDDVLKMRVVPVEESELASAEPGQQVVAELHFSLEQGLTVGYLGWYECQAKRTQ